MPDPTHITVTTPPDRVTPIHKDDGAAPGGVQLRASAAFVDRVRYSQSVRRSIARGDLIPCNMSGAAVPSIDLAAAPEELPGGRIERKPAAQQPAKETR
ncbi:MAG TPA: hypothetical protein VFZ00_11205 [Solirubrobacter sp.]|nr:hypothetical protein [Solirubrobacter sp.]